MTMMRIILLAVHEQYEEQKSNYDTVLDEQNTSLSFFKNVPFYSLCFDELAEYFRKQISETSKDIKLFTEHGDFFDRIVEDKSKKNKDSQKSMLQVKKLIQQK